MATQTLAQVRAAVKAAHPTATTAAINATARKDYSTQQKAVATPTTAKAPTAAIPAYQPGPGAAVTGGGPAAALTAPEYAVLVGGTAAAGSVDYVGQAKSWIAANIGTSTYTSQLFDRLQAYGNAYASGVDRSPALLQAAQVTQAALYQSEQISTGTGVGTVDRAQAFNQLVQQEGIYVTNANSQSAAGQAFAAALLAAQPAGAWMTTDSGVLVGGPTQKTAQQTLTPAMLAAVPNANATAPATSGATSSLIPNPMVSSTVTPSGTGTIYSAAVTGTGTAGGVTPSGATAGGEGGTSVSGGGSDAGNSSGIPDLSSATVAGFPLVDVLLIAGAGVGLWYVSKHRKKGGKK